MLALKGGTPTNTKPFSWYNSLGEEEIQATTDVLKSGILSGFYASAGEKFLGGPKVQELDQKWAQAFGSRYAVSMNSATSGLEAALGALSLKPGDEVILPPLTMSATATAILCHQATPVFADVEPDYFCLDPEALKKLINAKTRAILTVNLFGQPSDLQVLRNVADEYELTLIEDNAQAPGATLEGRFTGTWGHMGVFSLNCHKAIQCGEGGVVIADDEMLAKKLQLIRNHAEAVVNSNDDPSLTHLLGHNFRLTELQAAIALVQLRKLNSLNKRKQQLAQEFEKELSQFSFLQTPRIRKGATHTYYLYPIKYDPEILGISRDTFLKALNAEGFQAHGGYVNPLYRLPLLKKCQEDSCPVAEKLHDEILFYPDMIRYDIDTQDISLFSKAIQKICAHKSDLK